MSSLCLLRLAPSTAARWLSRAGSSSGSAAVRAFSSEALAFYPVRRRRLSPPPPPAAVTAEAAPSPTTTTTTTDNYDTSLTFYPLPQKMAPLQDSPSSGAGTEEDIDTSLTFYPAAPSPHRGAPLSECRRNMPPDSDVRLRKNRH